MKFNLESSYEGKSNVGGIYEKVAARATELQDKWDSLALDYDQIPALLTLSDRNHLLELSNFLRWLVGRVRENPDLDSKKVFQEYFVAKVTDPKNRGLREKEIADNAHFDMNMLSIEAQQLESLRDYIGK